MPRHHKKRFHGSCTQAILSTLPAMPPPKPLPALWECVCCRFLYNPPPPTLPRPRGVYKTQLFKFTPEQEELSTSRRCAFLLYTHVQCTREASVYLPTRTHTHSKMPCLHFYSSIVAPIASISLLYSYAVHPRGLCLYTHPSTPTEARQSRALAAPGPAHAHEQVIQEALQHAAQQRAGLIPSGQDFVFKPENYSMLPGQMDGRMLPNSLGGMGGGAGTLGPSEHAAAGPSSGGIAATCRALQICLSACHAACVCLSDLTTLSACHAYACDVWIRKALKTGDQASDVQGRGGLLRGLHGRGTRGDQLQCCADGSGAHTVRHRQQCLGDPLSGFCLLSCCARAH
eukprot:scaffold276180_cov19-Tisochrysis_lutea.AAC.1